MIVSLAAAAVVAAAIGALLARARGNLPTAARFEPVVRRARLRRTRRLLSRLSGAIAGVLRRDRRVVDGPARTEEHQELSRVLRLASRTAGDAHHLLRPALADIARGRLAGRGVDLDAEPVRARALLGDGLADLLDPDRPLPADFFAAGIPLAEIETHVAHLEAL